jgi:sugar phosphate isomerase/epimerase
MKKIVYLFVALALTLTLAACGAPTIDASSEEAMKASVEEMTKDMTEAEKMEFGMAIMAVSMKAGMSNMSNPEEADAAVKEALDGKTAEEIIAMSKE